MANNMQQWPPAASGGQRWPPVNFPVQVHETHHSYFRALLGPGRGTKNPQSASPTARALTEGGMQSLPQLHLPGGALLACAAGVCQHGQDQGHAQHHADRLAAEARFKSTSLPAAVAPRRWDAPSTSEPETPAPSETPAEAEGAEWYPPPAHLAARVQRNVPTLAHVCGSVGCKECPPLVQRPGVLGGVLYSGVDILLRGCVPWTFRRHKKGEIFCLLPSPAPTPAGL
ncbi:hypothetical protein C8J57DRAFT_1232308 [Mycena rebaudengoi]|nr:hypothetical protein C8J57DRAFT_1232308 [Mycena rebaudengoi]